MTTDFNSLVPPDDEAKITALLLGELSPGESAEVLAQLQSNPELALLYERLRQTLALVSEALDVSNKAGPSSKTKVLLSNRRRDELLSAFKTVAPIGLEEELEEKPRGGLMFWLRVAAVLAFVGVLAGLLLSSLAKAKAQATSMASGGASKGRPVDLAYGLPTPANPKAPSVAKSAQQATNNRLQELHETAADSRLGRLGTESGDGRPNTIFLPVMAGSETPVQVGSVLAVASGSFSDPRPALVPSETPSRTMFNVQANDDLGRGLKGGALDDSISKFGAIADWGAVVQTAPEAANRSMERAESAVMPALGTRYGLMPSVDVPENKERELLRESLAAARATSPPSPVPSMMRRYGLLPGSEIPGQAPPFNAPNPQGVRGSFAGVEIARLSKVQEQESRGESSRREELGRGLTANFRGVVGVGGFGGGGAGGGATRNLGEASRPSDEYFAKGSADSVASTQALANPPTNADFQERALGSKFGFDNTGEQRPSEGKSTSQAAGDSASAFFRKAPETPKVYSRNFRVDPQDFGIEPNPIAEASTEHASIKAKTASDDMSLVATAPAGAPGQNLFFENSFGDRQGIAAGLAVTPALARPGSSSFGLEGGTAPAGMDALGQPLGRISGSASPLSRRTRVPATETPTEKKSEPKVALAKKAALPETVAQARDKEAVPISDAPPAPEPQPEQVTLENAFSTFSLNVSDVSFKLAAASLASGTLPPPGTVRTEEFINAFDYRDPQPSAGSPIGFAWDRTRYTFGHNQDLLRFSLKTAALGREPGRPYNLVVLLDNSGSMERVDRVAIIHEILSALASQLGPRDRVSVVAFARTARLWVDGLPGLQAGEIVKKVSDLIPEGGTNLEEALRLGYETALRHFMALGVNRVILLTDGAANLGEVNPAALQGQVESHRKRGVALDCFGIGWEGYNDHLLELLSRHGDGRYGFVNSAEEAATGFVNQLAGAIHVAAADVKVQVEFNPLRVPAWRQVGYAKHQLKKEQFRDNAVDAAELAAAEAGNALYIARINPQGEGVIGFVRARFRVPSTGVYRELEWPIPYAGGASVMEQSSPAMRLAGTSAMFAEWLATSPHAAGVTLDKLQMWLGNVPEAFSPDPRPRQLGMMLQQARSISGK